MHHFCDTADVNASTAFKVITQKKMVVKSDLSFTKHNIEHFWCSSIPSGENNKSHVVETKFNEIKIKLGNPFAAKFYKMLKRRKV